MWKRFRVVVLVVLFVGVGVLLFFESVIKYEQQTQLELNLAGLQQVRKLVKSQEIIANEKQQHETQHAPCENNKGFGLDYPYLCMSTTPVIATYFGGSSTNPNQIANTPSLFAFIAVISNSGDFAEIPIDISLTAPTLQFWTVMNYYKGTIPQSVFSLTNLRQIFLNENFLTGTISSQFGLLSSLTMLDLHHNMFTGTFPTQIGFLTNLNELQFGNNPLMGTLPSQLGLLVNLRDLTINDLYSMPTTIPSQFGNMRELLSFSFHDGEIRGSIPSQLGKLTNLRELSGSHCYLTGVIPTELWNMVDLTKLLMTSNQLEGNLEGVSQLTQIQMIDVGGNHMTGTIPTQLGLLTSLLTLNLSRNFFSGTLPSQLALLTNLSTFDISELPLLEGSIPPEIRNSSLFSILSCAHTRLSDTDKCPLPTTTSQLVTTPLFASVSTLAGLLMCVLIMTGCYLWQHRRYKVVRVMSPILSIALLVSLLVMVVAVPILGVSVYAEETGMRAQSCKVSGVFVVTGVVGVVASVTARNYPIWRIFDNPQLKQVHISPTVLMLYIIGSVAIGLAIAIPLLNLLTISPNTLWCVLDTSNPNCFVLVLLLGAVVGVQALISVYVSFKIRDVSSEYHETQQIARATYNFVTFGVGMILLGMFTNNNVSRFLSLSLSILMCVSSFALFSFWPKIAIVREDLNSSRKSHVANRRPRKASRHVLVFQTPATKNLHKNMSTSSNFSLG